MGFQPDHRKYRVKSFCCATWVCCPSWMRVFLVFFAANILGDLLAFPFVHTFWNIVNFEGWFING